MGMRLIGIRLMISVGNFISKIRQSVLKWHEGAISIHLPL